MKDGLKSQCKACDHAYRRDIKAKERQALLDSLGLPKGARIFALPKEADKRFTRWLAPKAEPTEKTCTGCNLTKPVGEFSKDGKYKNGNVRYQSRCKECFNVYVQRNTAKKSAKRKAEREASLPVIPEGHLKCNSCHEIKLIDRFNKQNRNKRDRTGKCKNCINAAQRAKTPQKPKPKEGHKFCRLCKEEKPLDAFRTALKKNKAQKYHLCRPCEGIDQRRRQKANPESYNRIKAKQALKKKNDPVLKERQRIKHQTRYENDLEYRANCIRKSARRRKQRMKEDPLYRLSVGIRAKVSALIGKKKFVKSQKFREYLGCTEKFLGEHLSSQFTEGMSWDNYGQGRHLDHIVPISLAKNEHEIFLLSHYLNLQPLWEKDNRDKRDRIPDVLPEALIKHLGSFLHDIKGYVDQAPKPDCD